MLSRSELTIRNNQTGDTKIIKFDMQALFGEEVLEKLSKDKYNISGNAYYETTQLFKEMP